MTENDQPRFTFKFGAGYDAPWLGLPFTDPVEAKQKIAAIRDSGLLEDAAALAQLIHGIYAAPLAPQQNAPQEQPAPQAAWGSVTPQGFQPAQQGQQWQSGQQAPPQQQGGRPQAQTHPEGLTCPLDNKLLEFGKTRTNKGQWKCPDYRWNNGNPNEHRLEWAN